MKTYNGTIKTLPDNGIFVFGSNTEGRHGKGSAKIAVDNFGAIYGQSMGPQGQSFAIITKDLKAEKHPSITRAQIRHHIMALYNWAKINPELDFYVAYTAEGVNLNGYTPTEMAEMFYFEAIPDNIVFEDHFSKLVYANR